MKNHAINQLAPEDRLLTPAEVAALFRVDAKSVSRWVTAGKLSCIRTPSAGTGPGHRRYRETEVRALLAAGAETVEVSA